MCAFKAFLFIFGSIACVGVAMLGPPRDSQHVGGGHSVPELDPGSIGGALSLAGFGAMMLIDRRRPK